MPTIDHVFLCDYAFVDAAGKPSIIGIFDKFLCQRIPTHWPQMYVFLALKIAPGEEFEVSSQLTSPSGKELVRIKPQRITSPSNVSTLGKATVSLGFYNIQFSETGEYHIEILIDGNTVHSIPLSVQIRKAN